MTYFNSKDIKIFPCYSRGTYDLNQVYDPESRLITETNFTRIFGNLFGKKSYIINIDSDPNSKRTEVVINGYYFEINGFAFMSGKLWICCSNQTLVSGSEHGDSTRVTYALSSLNQVESGESLDQGGKCYAIGHTTAGETFTDTSLYSYYCLDYDTAYNIDLQQYSINNLTTCGLTVDGVARIKQLSLEEELVVDPANLNLGLEGPTLSECLTGLEDAIEDETQARDDADKAIGERIDGVVADVALKAVASEVEEALAAKADKETFEAHVEAYDEFVESYNADKETFAINLENKVDVTTYTNDKSAFATKTDVASEFTAMGTRVGAAEDSIAANTKALNAFKTEVAGVDAKADSNTNLIANLTGRLDDIVAKGGEPNTINTIKVNDVEVKPEDTTINIEVPVIADTEISQLKNGQALLAEIDSIEEAIGVASAPAIGEEDEEGYVPAVAATGLYKAIDDARAEVNALLAEVYGKGEGDEHVAGLADEVEALKAVDNATQEELNAYKLEVTEEIRVAKEAAISDADSKLANKLDTATFAEFQSTNTSAIATAQAQADKGVAAAAKVAGDLVAAKSSIETVDNTLTQKITALEGKDTTIEGNITALQTTVGGHTTTITEQGTKIAALEDKDTELAALIQGNTDKFADYSTTAQMNKAIGDAIAGADLSTYAKVTDVEAIYKSGVDGGAATGVLADEITRATAAEKANRVAIAALIGTDTSRTIRAIVEEEVANKIAKAINAYAVAFDSNGGTGYMAPQIVIGDSYTLPEESDTSFSPPDGHSFAGWAVSPVPEGNSPLTGIYTLAGNITFYAQWTVAASGDDTSEGGEEGGEGV